MLKGRESEGGESCGAVGLTEASADDGKGKRNGFSHECSEGSFGRPGGTEEMKSKSQRYFRHLT